MKRRSVSVDCLLVALGVLALISVSVACSSSQVTMSSTGAATPSSTAARSGAGSGTGAVKAEVAASELVVGSNRFVLGLLDGAGKPIADASAHLTFFDVNGAQPVVKAQAEATFRAPSREAGLQEQIEVTRPDGSKRIQLNAPSDVGVYVAAVSFDRTGNWGVEAAGKLKNGSPYTARAGFTVVATGATPAIGSAAPRSHNLTVKDAADLAQIDTSATPSADMHTESIAEGLAAGRPLLILFATPGYCASRFCGPELELARKLEPKYKSRVDFIHVEIYKDPGQRIPVDAVNEYHLPSEPWFFIVDDKGVVRAKFEGPTSIAELDEALQQLIS